MTRKQSRIKNNLRITAKIKNKESRRKHAK
jgi:hypothetical protein